MQQKKPTPLKNTATNKKTQTGKSFVLFQMLLVFTELFTSRECELPKLLALLIPGTHLPKQHRQEGAFARPHGAQNGHPRLRRQVP